MMHSISGLSSTMQFTKQETLELLDTVGEFRCNTYVKITSNEGIRVWSSWDLMRHLEDMLVSFKKPSLTSNVIHK